ncbi:porin family protein [candidate division KSB1 bacterium]
MKRFICITVLMVLLVLTVSASAQHRAGVIGGFNFANAKDELYYHNNRTFPGFGGVFDLDLKRNFSLHITPMFIRKGWGGDKYDASDRSEVKFSYLEIPFFLKIDLASTIRPYVFTGPWLAFLLSSEVETEENGIMFTGDIKHITKSLDIGFGYGAGISLPVKNFAVFLEFRSTIGSDINKGGEIEFESDFGNITTTIENSQVKHKDTRILFGITLPVKW